MSVYVVVLQISQHVFCSNFSDVIIHKILLLQLSRWLSSEKTSTLIKKLSYVTRTLRRVIQTEQLWASQQTCCELLRFPQSQLKESSLIQIRQSLNISSLCEASHILLFRGFRLEDFMMLLLFVAERWQMFYFNFSYWGQAEETHLFIWWSSAAIQQCI